MSILPTARDRNSAPSLPRFLCVVVAASLSTGLAPVYAQAAPRELVPLQDLEPPPEEPPPEPLPPPEEPPPEPLPPPEPEPEPDPPAVVAPTPPPPTPPAPPQPVPPPPRTASPPPAPPPAHTAQPSPPTPAPTSPPPQAPLPRPAPPPRASAPPAATPASPPPAPPPKTEQEEEDTYGLFGPLRLGPYVGTGLPNVLNFGGTAKFFDYLGFGLNMGIIPDIKVSYYGEATLRYREYDAYGRLYPFGGAFFVGAGVGYHSAEGTFTKTVSTPLPQLPEASVTTRGSVRAMILTPQLGWFVVFGSGFALGFDVGAQMPIAPSEIELSTDLPDTVPQELVEESTQEVRDELDTLGKTIIPVFNIRLGFLL